MGLARYFSTSLLLCAPLWAESDIPYGIEFVAGVRSGYHQKGVSYANDLLDLQLQSNITVTKSSSLNFAIWQGAEISGDFREFGSLVSATKSYDEFSVTGELAYYNLESPFLENGAEASIMLDYQLSDEISVYGSLGYSEGAQSLIGLLGVSGGQIITDDSFLEAKVEFHLADNYYGREGLYDLTSRLSFTYNINSLLSTTPFVSAAIPLDGAGEFDLSTGVWIEIFF